MGELVSVIIPVYKVELYLERCIVSVVEQTYQNLEIILVDDGSPDRCGVICEEWALKDNRIKVYHKENGGLSDARNYGVSKSNGKYITFIDSDDYVAPNFIEYLYDLIVKYDADMSSCFHIKTSDDTVDYKKYTFLPKEKVVSGKDGFRVTLGILGKLRMLYGTAWGRLYKSDIVKKHSFPVGRLYEDISTTCKHYYESKKVVLGNYRLYAYFQNPTSIMHSITKEVDKDALWALEHRARFFEEHGEKSLAQLSWQSYLHYCIKDSLQNDGRCDVFLNNFDTGKILSKRVRLEYQVYKKCPFLFKLYLGLESVLRKLKSLFK